VIEDSCALPRQGGGPKRLIVVQQDERDVHARRVQLVESAREPTGGRRDHAAAIRGDKTNGTQAPEAVNQHQTRQFTAVETGEEHPAFDSSTDDHGWPQGRRPGLLLPSKLAATRGDFLQSAGLKRRRIRQAIEPEGRKG